MSSPMGLEAPDPQPIKSSSQVICGIITLYLLFYDFIRKINQLKTLDRISRSHPPAYFHYSCLYIALHVLSYLITHVHLLLMLTCPELQAAVMVGLEEVVVIVSIDVD